MAVIALKMRLVDQTHVSCDIAQLTADTLLRGRVGPCTVKGRGWQSIGGLTCRAIEASVDSCDLDFNSIITKQKLRLTTPANGKAMISLNDKDFGNFITHHLVRPPVIAGDSQIEFIKEGIQIDAKKGQVTFLAAYNGEQYKCILKRGLSAAGKADLQVVSESGKESRQMREALSKFFNEMIFELDGTFLSFNDLMITDKGEAPSVMLALKITVHKFPSRGSF
jgi:hypothetical protein